MTVCPSITPGFRGIETGELLKLSVKKPRSGFSESLCYKEVVLNLEITTPLGFTGVTYQIFTYAYLIFTLLFKSIAKLQL